ncbi:MAG: vWA domain-containing protein, partial [Pseudomonadota bacterium]
AVVAAMTFAPEKAEAVGVDVELMFVIDQSGSMGDEFTFLGGAIGGFLSDLQADSRINSAKAGLISYERNTTLHSDLTSDASALSAVFAGVPTFGGFEDAYNALDEGITNPNISYSANAVKSLILITDEDQDGGYSNSFGSGQSALASLIDDQGFLLNIIYNPNSGSSRADFDALARPSTGLFSINDFRNDRQGFFADFTAAKIAEVTAPPSVIPLPGGLPLLLGGLVVFGGIASRRRKAA